MSTAKKGRRRRLLVPVYVLLSAGILWQSYAALRALLPVEGGPSRLVKVAGKVKRPGVYRVSAEATQFEVLRVAGVQPFSDLSQLDLTATVFSDQIIKVASSDQAVELNPSQGVRLEFFLGDISIIAGNGSTRTRSQGISLNTGDRLMTEAQAQAELSLNSFSRVDLAEFGELSLDRISVKEGEKTVTEMFQKSGTCWYKLAYTAPEQLFRITTRGAVMTVAGNGADFLVEIGPDQTAVHNFSGLLLVERPMGTEAINLIAGQTATVFGDERPFQVGNLTLETSPNERFSKLHEERRTFLQSKLPLNLLLCGIPSTYYLININFDKGIVNVIQIPHITSVELFMQGASTLDQAMLFGGAVTVSTLVESLLDIIVPKYCVIDKDQLVWTGSALGGITIDVDRESAVRMGLRPGSQKLNGDQLAQYLRPGDNREGARDRQLAVIKGLFEQMRTRNIVITAILAQQLASGIETNITAGEFLAFYQNFASKANWGIKSLSLPVTRALRGKTLQYDPDLTKSRAILHQES